jgi:broad specificity phosphatase PhoE
LAKLLFTSILLFIAITFTFAQEVILIRHAKVDMNVKGWMGHKKAAQFNQQYNTAPIVSFNVDSVRNTLPKITADTIYTSALYRSKTTAKILFEQNHTLISRPLFNEFESFIVKWPIILPYKGWTVFSRIFWLLGNKREGVESWKEARERTQKVTDFIETESQNQQQVVFVTHGFLNRQVAKELEKRGWQRTVNNGKKNLGATVLVKREE